MRLGQTENVEENNKKRKRLDSGHVTNNSKHRQTQTNKYVFSIAFIDISDILDYWMI